MGRQCGVKRLPDAKAADYASGPGIGFLTRDMASIAGTIRINAPQERVFDAAANVRNEPSYNPATRMGRGGRWEGAGRQKFGPG